MRRMFFLTLLLFAVLLAGLGALNSALVALSFPLLFYLAGGLYLAPVKIDLRATREVDIDRTQPGNPVTIQVLITNHGPALDRTIIEDQIPEGVRVTEGETHFLTSLDTSETLEFTYTVQAKRGIYPFREVKVTATDPLWLIKRSTTIPASAQLLMQPTVEEIERIPIRPRNTRVYAGYIPARQGGPGVDFFGVRQYRSGDPLRWINWKASARFQHNLYINQYEQRRITDVGLILDTRKRSEVRAPRGISLFEHSIDATAALANRFLTDGNRVGLLLYGTQLDWTLPGYSKIQKERIKNSLARAELGDSLVFDKLENIPTRLLPPKSQVVLVSPLQPDDLSVLINLRAHGYSVLVVSPDPIAFEHDHLKGDQDQIEKATRFAQIERTSLLKQLRQAGVQVINWDVNEALQTALHRSYQRPQRSIFMRGIKP